MHLHDVLRSWRDEIVGPSPQVALSEEDAGVALPVDLPRAAVPGGLRRDDPSGLAVRLMPAAHAPARPATAEALDRLEEELGFELPRGIELLLRLHDGGDFYVPTLPGLPDRLARPVHLLSTVETGQAYAELASTLRGVLLGRETDKADLFRYVRRFGVGSDAAGRFVDRLWEILRGAETGLPVIPLARAPAQPEDLVCFVPDAGSAGRVGYLSAAAGFLPEHSDDLAFDGLEGWLLATLRSRGCARLVLT